MNAHSDSKLIDEDSSRTNFLESFKIADNIWEAAQINWSELVSIADDHQENFPSLAASAAMYAGIIQGITGVHSVRWRVKDPKHLIGKIIRKKAAGKENYKDISVGNYYQIVTDLVGIRALHLFKDEFQVIHDKLSPLLADKETPVANIRQGDNEKFSDLCRKLGFEVNEHPAGYRSIHYVKTVKPLSRDLHIEIQVRTVFEEGWSEIDHQVRYPNFSDDPLVIYASLMLNRLSGMADEMSTYAKQLVAELDSRSMALKKYQSERDSALERIEQLFAQLDETRQDQATQKSSLIKLKEELYRMKSSYEAEKNINSGVINIRGLDIANIFPNLNSDLSKHVKISSIANELSKFGKAPEED